MFSDIRLTKEPTLNNFAPNNLQMVDGPLEEIQQVHLLDPSYIPFLHMIFTIKPVTMYA